MIVVENVDKKDLMLNLHKNVTVLRSLQSFITNLTENIMVWRIDSLYLRIDGLKYLIIVK